jgi:CO dehydrogenase/acetyl-CoA synthase alpha subunit
VDRHVVCNRQPGVNDYGGNGFGNHGSNVSAAHMAAAAPTVAVIPAAADEVSASIANLISQHAANYQVASLTG